MELRGSGNAFREKLSPARGFPGSVESVGAFGTVNVAVERHASGDEPSAERRGHRRRRHGRFTSQNRKSKREKANLI